MYAELALSTTGDGVVHELYDLTCKSHAGDGAGVVGSVERKVPFVLVGEGAELEQGVWSEEVGR